METRRREGMYFEFVPVVDTYSICFVRNVLRIEHAKDNSLIGFAAAFFETISLLEN